MKKLLNKQEADFALKVCVCAILAFAAMMTVYYVMPALSFSDDLWSRANNAISDTQQKLVNFALAMFPVSLIVIALIVFFTKDERKVGIALKAAITVCVAIVAILLINAGVVITTLGDWFGVDVTGG